MHSGTARRGCAVTAMLLKATLPVCRSPRRGRFVRALALGLFSCFVFAVTGCNYVGALLGTYSPEVPEASVFRHRDGGTSLFFTVDKSVTARPAIERTYVFVISGSGCTSMKFWLPQYFTGLEGEYGPLRIFVVQKRGITERSWGRIAGCPDDFAREDHPQRWLTDYREFIHEQLASYHPAHVVLVGISEGAEIVPLLARHIPAVTHIVLLGSGAMDPLDAFALQAVRQHSNGYAHLSDLLRQFADSSDVPRHALGGHTPRYWSELGELHPGDDLIESQLPVMVGMGERDEALPIESAWALRERFDAHAPGRLTLLTYAGADHALFDRLERKSRLPDFWHAVDLWLGEQR